MPKIDNVEIHGLDRVFRTAKYPKAADTGSVNNDLTPGIRACLTCKPGEGHDNALKGIVVLFDLTFSEELYQQANARLHRTGQKESVIIHHIVAKGTMDERVMQALKKKDEVQRALLDALKAEIKKG